MSPGQRAVESLLPWLAAHDIAVTAPQRDRLGRYLDLLERWGRRINLVGDPDPFVAAREHLTDGLMAAAHLPDPAAPLADLGSGAGFPGVPIAVCHPEHRVVLVEPRAKRASFLEAVAAELDIDRVAVVEARAEALAELAEHRGVYAVVTARAVASLDSLCALARPLLAPRGTLLAMKGTRGVAEMAALPETLGAQALADHCYHLPNDAEHHLIHVRFT